MARPSSGLPSSAPQVATSTGSAEFIDPPLLQLQKTPSDATTPHRAASTLSTAASHVAFIYEIILEICKIVSKLSYPHGLAALTTVSRFVSSIALDVLWEKQTSLAPLFKTIARVERRFVRLRRYSEGQEVHGFFNRSLTVLMTMTVLKIPCDHQLVSDNSETSRDHGPNYDEEPSDQDASDDGGSEYSSSERSDDGVCEEKGCDPNQLALTDDEYETFSRYAARIRTFEPMSYWLGDPNTILVDSALFCAALRRGPLLPQARVVNLSRQALPLHGGHLTDVPHLGNDHVRLFGRRDVGPGYAGQLCPLAHIREITMHPDRRLSVLSHLRDLPFLEKLHLIVVRKLIKGVDQRPLKPGFRALRSLGISGTWRHNIVDARVILFHMSSQPLRLRAFLHRSCQRPSVSTDLDHTPAHDLFRELRARLDPGYLEDLAVTTARCRHHESAREMFADLCAFPNVHEACVNLAGSPVVDVDEVLDVLTHAWPALRKFSLENDPFPDIEHQDFQDPYMETRRYATLAGLSPLARRCPRLRILSIPLRVDEDHIPRPLEHDTAHLSVARQVGIDVGKAVVGDKAVEVAAFLVSIFPSVQFVSACDAVATVDDGWKNVEHLINQAGETVTGRAPK